MMRMHLHLLNEYEGDEEFILSSAFEIYLQTHLTFGQEFTQAVELKQVAQQEAERARWIVERVWRLRLQHLRC